MNISALTSSPAKLKDLVQTQALKPLSTPTVRSDGSAAKPSASDIKKAASQFEAIILRQLLKPSIEPMMSGGSMGGAGGSGSSGGGMYGYILTDTLANSLSAGGGLGLSSILEKQFTQATVKPAALKSSS